MKKLLSVLLVVLLCVGVCPISTLAADEEFVLTAEGGLALVGGKITVPVVVTKNSGWRALEVRVSYDADVLEIECPNHNDSEYCMGESAPVITKKEDFAMAAEYECDNLGVNSPRHTANPYIFQWAYPTIGEDITETGTYASITFKVKDEAALGDTTVGLYIDVITNCNYEHPTTLTKDATVSVVEEFPVPEAPATVKGKDSNGVLKDIHANDDTTSVTVESYDAVKNEVNLSFSYDTTHEAYGDTVEWYKGDELVATGLTATVPYNTYNANDYSVVVEYENYLGSSGSFESYAANTNLVLPNKTVTLTSDDGNSTINVQYHDGMPTSDTDKWGVFTNCFWSKIDGYYLPDGYSYDRIKADYPYITEQGAFANRGQQVYVHTSAWNGVSPKHGKNYARLVSATSQVVKNIDGLTPGKQYVVSMYTYVPSTGNGVGAVQVGNNVVDIYNGSARANTRGSKVYSYTMTQGKDNQTYSPDGWRKLVFYFTPDQSTAYLSITFGSSSSCIDNLVCKEVQPDDIVPDWNFEDGNVTPFGFNNSSERFVMADLVASNQGTFAVKDTTDSDPEKLGGKYFELTAATAANSYNNYATANFYYNGTDRYVVSFDMKMINFSTAAGSKFEMFLGKSNGTGHILTSYLAANAAVNYDGQTLTRYYENGKAYRRAINPNSSSSHYMFTTTTLDDSSVGFSDLNGGDLWNEWSRWVIEIDPSKDNGYEGFVSLGWHLNSNTQGAVLGLDNIKVEKYSIADINAANDNFNSTYAYNIRSASSGFKQGLRFKSSIDLDVVDSLGEGSKVVEYGTLAATKQAYQNIAALNTMLLRENAGDKAIDSYAVAGVAFNRDNGTDIRYSINEETNVVTYTGVIIGMDVSQFNMDFVIRGYVIIEDAKGMRTVVYGDVQTLNMYQAAAAVVANPKTDDDAAAAQEVITQWNEYKGIE